MVDSSLLRNLLGLISFFKDKIEFLQVSEWPGKESLKEKFPEDYKILEKNGKKFHDKIKKKSITNKNSIYDLVIDI